MTITVTIGDIIVWAILIGLMVLIGLDPTALLE